MAGLHLIAARHRLAQMDCGSGRWPTVGLGHRQIPRSPCGPRRRTDRGRWRKTSRSASRDAARGEGIRHWQADAPYFSSRSLGAAIGSTRLMSHARPHAPAQRAARSLSLGCLLSMARSIAMPILRRARFFLSEAEAVIGKNNQGGWMVDSRAADAIGHGAGAAARLPTWTNWPLGVDAERLPTSRPWRRRQRRRSIFCMPCPSTWGTPQ